MRREVVYRAWIALACLLSFASGAALWMAGERPFAVCGLAAGGFHALWAIDLRALVHGRWRRRAIVIPRLRPMVVSPPPRTFVRPLRTMRRRHG